MEMDNDIPHKHPPGRAQADSSDKSPSPAETEAAEPPGEPTALPESRYDLQILQSMRRIIRAVDTYSRKLRSTCRLTAPQLICLLNIVEKEQTTTTKIAREVFLTPSTVVGILDRLEARGLIARSRDTGDRRVVNVTATEEGRTVAESAPSPLQDRLGEALNRLPVSEQAAIASSLKRVVDLMEAEHFEAAPILETDQPDLHKGENGNKNK
jgi:DNA-binding MarR family transcriptional regulator